MSTQSVEQRPGSAVARRSRERRFSPRDLLEGRAFVRLGFAVDALMIALAAGAAGMGAEAAGVPLQSIVPLMLFPVLTLMLTSARGVYRPRLRPTLLDDLGAILTSVSVAAMLTIAALVMVAPAVDAAPLVARAWLFGLVYLSGARVLLIASQRAARRRGALVRPALIVGAGVVGARVARRLEEHPEYGMRPIGFLDADPPASIDVVDRRAPVLGTPSDLADVVQRTGAGHVILAFTIDPDADLLPLVRQCHRLGVGVSLVPRLFDSMSEHMSVEHLGGMPLLAVRRVDPKGWQFAIKHCYDRVFAALAIVMLSPILLAATIAVKLSSPGPVLYRLGGVGRDGRIFQQYKFRSMRSGEEDEEEEEEEDANGFRPRPGFAPGGVEGEDRRTPVGRFLRKSAIDELPQLFNVLKGEMSLVGPRPERPEYAVLFLRDVERYDDRHRVRAGLTGWAQVHGLRGQQTSLADKIEWDNYYIENWSLWLDAKILLMTLVTFFNSGDPD